MGSRRRAAKKHTTIEFANASVHWWTQHARGRHAADGLGGLGGLYFYTIYFQYIIRQPYLGL